MTGDFTARTEVHATLVGFGDAAALTVRVSSEQWAKICVGRSPVGEVSVVTDPWSDDANGELLTAPAEVLVGVHAQAPFVGGCQARFDHLVIDHDPVADFGSGE